MEETWIKEQRAWKSLLWNYGMPQKKFAEDNGFNEAQLSQWLNGKQKIGNVNKAKLLMAIVMVKNEHALKQLEESEE